MSDPIRINPIAPVPFEDIYIHFTLPEEYKDIPMDYIFVLQDLCWRFDNYTGEEITVALTEELVNQLCLGTYEGLLQVCDDEEYITLVIQEFIISEQVETSYITTIPVPVIVKEDRIEVHNQDPNSHPFILNTIDGIKDEIYNYGDIVSYNADYFYPNDNPNGYIDKDFIRPFEPLILDKLSGNLYVKNTNQIPTIEEVQQIHTNESNISNLQSNKQDKSNLVTEVSSQSTDEQYPSAKLFYDTIGNLEELINNL